MAEDGASVGTSNNPLSEGAKKVYAVGILAHMCKVPYTHLKRIHWFGSGAYDAQIRSSKARKRSNPAPKRALSFREGTNRARTVSECLKQLFLLGFVCTDHWDKDLGPVWYLWLHSVSTFLCFMSPHVSTVVPLM